MNRFDSENPPESVVKEGMRFRDKQSGKVYILRAICRGEVFLKGEDGRGRRVSSLKNLKVTCEKLEEEV